VPRLILVPLLEPLLIEHAKFFYARSFNKFIARGFYDGTSSRQEDFSDDLKKKMGENGDGFPGDDFLDSLSGELIDVHSMWDEISDED